MRIRTTRQKIRFSLLLITLLLFPVVLNYLSPYLIIAGASEGVVNGSMILFVLLFLSAMIFGRGWCGWVCPAAGLGEICALVQTRQIGKRPRWIKWGVWVIWLTFILMAVISAGGYQRIEPLYMTESFVSVVHPYSYIVYYSVLATIVILNLSVGKRGFCHTVCWMAPFMIGGRTLSNVVKTPALRLVADDSLCTDCLTCSKNCPMSLDVHTMVKQNNMENPDCILCGQCVDGCSQQAIRFTFATPQKSRIN